MAISIQFYGADQVVDALDKSKCPCWAIFQGRQFMFKCELTSMEESKQLLSEILDNLAENPIIYTLKLYECPEGETIKIDERTKCDGGSFNFKVIGEDWQSRRESYIGSGGNAMVRRSGGNAFDTRLTALEENQKRILELLEGDEDADEDQPLDIHQEIIGLLRDPEKVNMWLGILRGDPNVKIPQTIGNTMGQNKQPGAGAGSSISENLSQPTEEDLQRLSNALDILGKNDPKIIDHLCKLADLSQNNKPTFNMAVKMLEGM